MTTAAAEATPLCALHPDLPSAGTCARCGRFACGGCFRPDAGLCAECALRVVDPLGVQGPFSVGGALASGWKLFGTAPWTVVGVSVAMALAGSATSFLATVIGGDLRSTGASRFLPSLVNFAKLLFVGTWLHGALLAQMAAAARGEAITSLQAVGRSARAWPRMFGAQLVAGVLFLLGIALCVLPGLYAAAALWVVLPVAYLEPGRPAAETSGELTRGRRWEVLAVLLVSRAPQLAALAFGYVTILLVVRFGEMPLGRRALVMGTFGFAADVGRCALECFEVSVVLASYLKLRGAAPLKE
jgi:hypothetical protein